MDAEVISLSPLLLSSPDVSGIREGVSGHGKEPDEGTQHLKYDGDPVSTLEISLLNTALLVANFVI